MKWFITCRFDGYQVTTLIGFIDQHVTLIQELVIFEKMKWYYYMLGFTKEVIK